MLKSARVLFVENDDSFSWNVIDRLPVERSDVQVLPSAELKEVLRALETARILVIGPGPRDPQRVGLVDVVTAAAARRLPTLGICLGHQALGVAFGARLTRTEPRHGVEDTVVFGASRFFSAFRGPVEVMRYHSLVLDRVVEPLSVVARTADGLPMAIEHATLPMAGLQFHPDSFGTPRGPELFASFFRAVA